MYFGNYRRLVYLAQTDDPALTAKARAAADTPRPRLRATLRRGLGDLGAPPSSTPSTEEPEPWPR